MSTKHVNSEYWPLVNWSSIFKWTLHFLEIHVHAYNKKKNILGDTHILKREKITLIYTHTKRDNKTVWEIHTYRTTNGKFGEIQVY